MAGRIRTLSSVSTEADHLNAAACEPPRVRRDWRFDGQFFSGVRTTRIYCRPVCPVRPAKAENVSFYPSAAAAERAGFRPCLRRRPETAPFSPAWKGSLTTVERAIRLIDAGALDDPNIAEAGAAGLLGRVSVHNCERLDGQPRYGELHAMLTQGNTGARIMGANISFDTSMNFALLMAVTIGLMFLVGRIAERRGRSFTTWASIAAIIGPFALPLVFFLPILQGKNGDPA